ncbi:hypothetical protein THRCLA_04819 [Thraustotheca clavata]|uniref:Uncharacterized protein n=1 Tax=Thraustotheca clavata TaxID=74557 RepID=A0A1V9ZY25_9STRA|nr:hypothetical protein THRCLA_04819 [Thraustotheca clavata]
MEKSIAEDIVIVHEGEERYTEKEKELIDKFIGTKRVLGHCVGENVALATRIIWIYKGGKMQHDAINKRYESLRKDAQICVDLIYLYEKDTSNAQMEFDHLMHLNWHEKAYCFDVCRGDHVRLAQVLAILLSVPSHRDAQSHVETLLNMPTN